MPGLNTTGAPNTRDYSLGRGIVRLASLAASGLPDANGFRDLGNAPEFNISLTVEDLRHQSSREQLKFTDKRVTISQEIGVSFILDEMNFNNLSDFFVGSTETYDNPHDTTWLTTNLSVISSSIKVGNWYQLHDDGTAGSHGPNRVYNLGAASLVHIFEKDPGGVPVALVEGADQDFVLDEEMGLVRFLAGGPAALVDGDSVGWRISVAAAVPEDLSQVNALQRADVVGALLFIGTNAADQGNKTEYLFHRVSISPDGDLPLIGDEWMQASFSGVAEVNSAVTDPSKVLTVRTYDQLT